MTNPTVQAMPSAAITDWFRVAAPYIHKHRHATLVIAIDGETIRLANFDNLVHDLAILTSLGIRLVVVYDAHPQIAAQCQKQQVTLNYHQGLPVITELSLSIVKTVIGQLRLDIEARLSLSMPHTPMADARICCTSGNLVTAKPVGIREGIDFGYTGEVRRIDIDGIKQQIACGNIVLLPPLGVSPTGEIFYVSAEAVASQSAIALAADKLIFIGNRYTDAREITLAEAAQLLTKPCHHIIALAIKACRAGVKRVHLLDRAIDGALLQELFSRDGAGTLISADSFERIRQATIDDVGGILQLITPLEKNGTLVKRSRDVLETGIDDFMVMVRDGAVIACAALHRFHGSDITELACLAVAGPYQNLGRGERLLAASEKKAQTGHLCVLTTQTAHWFLERGFAAASIADLPVAKKALYNYQRNAKALIKTLR